jgi:DNA-binding GntR family transcriptional regulator
MAFLSVPPTPYRTKQEFAYRRLRDAMLRCALAPGQRLIIDELARSTSSRADSA